ncbi:MAG TPA: GNAT family N-acetyltransferase [Gemmatimonadaceae bacterium]|nr:GNAT family N-acetyltransferase [Gemmatimonadaceae bacterium]
MTKLLAVTLRQLSPADVPAMRRLLHSELGGTPYADALFPIFDLGLEGTSAESKVLIAAAGDEVVGFILYGLVAGAAGAGRLHLIVVTAAARLSGVASRLMDAAIAELAELGARLVIAELADDPVLVPAHALLRRSHFVEEARISDFYREGVAQVVLGRRVARGG